MKRQRYTYTLLMDGDAVAQAYKVVMLPTLYVIGRDGRILHAERGYRETAEDELPLLVERWLR